MFLTFSHSFNEVIYFIYQDNNRTQVELDQINHNMYNKISYG